MDSLQAQTFRDFEIVVSDDMSTDLTREILMRYATLDHRIRILKNAEHRGLQSNFQFITEQCVGKFIAPCDQDDIWLPKKLEVLIALIKERQCSLVYCDLRLFGEGIESYRKTMFDKFTPVEGNDALQFAFKNCVSGHACLFEAALLRHALPFPAAPLYDWWLAAMASSCKGISFTREPLVLYRQHSSNVTDPLGRRKRKDLSHSLERRKRRRRTVVTRLYHFKRCPGNAGNEYNKLHRLWTSRTPRFLNLSLISYLFRYRKRLLGTRGSGLASTCMKIFSLVI